MQFRRVPEIREIPLEGSSLPVWFLPPGGEVSAQVEVPVGGHEHFDRLGRDACHVLDAVDRAVVAVVPMQLGHSGDVLFGVQWKAVGPRA